MPSLPVFQVDYPYCTNSTRLPVFKYFYPFWEFRFPNKIVVFLQVNIGKICETTTHFIKVQHFILTWLLVFGRLCRRGDSVRQKVTNTCPQLAWVKCCVNIPSRWFHFRLKGAACPRWQVMIDAFDHKQHDPSWSDE